MGSDRLSRANITVYDPSLPGTRVLRVTTGNGHMTRPTDTPANTFFLPGLTQPADMSRNMFAPGTTSGRSKVGLGDVIISNADGALDGWMTYAFDGRPITIEDGTLAGGFTSVLVATMDGTPEFGVETITIHLRDRQAELDVPLQANLYLGNNALPAGLEGVSDLKGQKKPFCLGQVMNIPAKCVNTPKLIYQVNDGAVASVDAVYDRGIALGASLFAVSGPASGGNIALSVDSAKWKVAANAVGVNITGNCALQGVPGTLVMGVGSGITYSTDGTVWSQVVIDASFITFSLAFDGTHYVALGARLGVVQIWSSTSLTSGWTLRATGFTGANGAQSLCWDSINAQFVAVGLSGQVATSPTGTTWTMQTAVAGAPALVAVVAGATLLVAISSAGGIYTSPTGAAWTSRTSPLTGASSGCLAFGKGMFVAGGGAHQVAYSPDGVTWTLVATPFTTATVTSATYVASQFMLGGDNGFLVTSPDTVNWTLVSTGYTPGAYRQIYAIMYAQNLGGVIYANNTDLLDDTKAPNPGCYGVCPSTGYVRVGSTPAGQITADVTEGATAADRTVAQLFKRALLKAGKTAADYVAADFVALDALNSAVCGIWIDDDSTVSSVLDQIAGSIWAWWSPDRAGLYRIKQFAAPSGASTFSFSANDLRKPLEVTATSDAGKGVPAYRTIVRYAKNYTVQTTDLAAGVSAARRVVLAAEWQAAQYLTAGVQTAHLLAPEITEDSCLVNESDALAEATRRQGIRGTRRDRFPLLVELTDANAQIDFGDVGTLTHKRYGLSAGTLVRVLGAEPNKAQNQALLTVWR